MSVVELTRSETAPRPGEEQRVVLHDISWQSYETIGKALQDRPVRLTYVRGSLEIMTLSPRHEFYKRCLGRFVETTAEELGVAIKPGGSMTFHRQDLERGFEPDESFWVANEPAVRGKMDWDPTRDPPPDLVVEIDITSNPLDRMGSYATLGVPEVWRFDGVSLHVFRLDPDGNYQPSDRSLAFPTLSLSGIAQFLETIETTDYLSLIRAFRAWLRASGKK